MATKKKRNFRKEYDNYQGRPAQIKRRASRNKARRIMIKKGRARKGDGMDVDHKNSNPLRSAISNLRVITKRANRSFKRTRTAREARRKR